MANPSVVEFWRDTGALMRNLKKAEVSYNKTAFQRRADPTYKGMVPNSKGSWTTMNGTNWDQSYKPLTGQMMEGGIRSNKNYQDVQKFIKRRAIEFSNVENPDQPPQPLPTLSPEDAKKTELFMTLDNLADAMIGNSTDNASQVKASIKDGKAFLQKVYQQLIPLIPALDGEDMDRIQNAVYIIIENLLGSITQKGNAILFNAKNPQVVFYDDLLQLEKVVNEDILPALNLSPAERRLRAQAIARKLKVKNARAIDADLSNVAEEVIRAEPRAAQTRTIRSVAQLQQMVFNEFPALRDRFPTRNAVNGFIDRMRLEQNNIDNAAAVGYTDVLNYIYDLITNKIREQPDFFALEENRAGADAEVEAFLRGEI